MTFEEFCSRESFTKPEILAQTHGTLVTDAPPEWTVRLPAPPMLMVDRILEISRKGPRGRIVAERDVHVDDWFFQCHFLGDPVQPGCLGLDAMWQIVGFFLAWIGNPGHGRALGVGEVKFTGQVLPTAKQVSYHINIKRVIARKLVLGVADGVMKVDGREIYSARDLRVGLFTSTDNF